MTMGQMIRVWRKRRGLTQRRLAALCGLTGGAISSYENDVTTPRRPALERIARALEVPVERLSEETAVETDGEAICGGILALLRELYGAVEARTVVGENGLSRRYYLVSRGEERFVLYEGDVDALARSARASVSPLAEYLRRVSA